LNYFAPNQRADNDGDTTVRKKEGEESQLHAFFDYKKYYAITRRLG